MGSAADVSECFCYFDLKFFPNMQVRGDKEVVPIDEINSRKFLEECFAIGQR
jgi:hypothetical protein